MLEEVGHPDRTELLDFDTTMKAPADLAINPMGKLPAIRHHAEIVTVGAAVCACLAAALPQAGPGPAHGSAPHQALGQAPDALEQRVDLTGAGTCAADIHVGSHLGRGMSSPGIEVRPAFTRYWQRLAERPAAQRAKEIDDALLPARG